VCGREWTRGIDGWTWKATNLRLRRRVGILGRKWNKSEKRRGAGWRKRKELRLSIPTASLPVRSANFYPRGACFISDTYMPCPHRSVPGKSHESIIIALNAAAAAGGFVAARIQYRNRIKSPVALPQTLRQR